MAQVLAFGSIVVATALMFALIWALDRI